MKADRVVPPTKPEPQEWMTKFAQDLWTKREFGTKDIAELLAQHFAEAVAPPTSLTKPEPQTQDFLDSFGTLITRIQKLGIHSWDELMERLDKAEAVAPPVELHDLCRRIITTVLRYTTSDDDAITCDVGRAVQEIAPLLTVEAVAPPVSLKEENPSVSAHNVAASREALGYTAAQVRDQVAFAKSEREALIREIAQELRKQASHLLTDGRTGAGAMREMAGELLAKYGVQEK